MLTLVAYRRGVQTCALCGRALRRQPFATWPPRKSNRFARVPLALSQSEVSPQRADNSRNRPSTRTALNPAVGSRPDVEYYATCAPGLESVLAAELVSQHISAVNVRPGRAGVSFMGSRRTGLAAVLWLRTAVRVLVKLKSGDMVSKPGARGGDTLYDFIRNAANWKLLLRTGQTFSVQARVWDNTDLPSEQLAATRAKDAICDALRDARGEKPSPPPQGEPGDLPLFLSCYRDKAILYRDMCGASLHKRGYRTGDAIHRAALNETVAAGVLSLLNWTGAPAALHAGAPPSLSPAVLVDPMCGSGTLLIEAALMATNTAPGLLRTTPWPFQSWPDYSDDASLWSAAQDQAREAGSQSAGKSQVVLLGCDSHAGALTLAQSAAHRAGVDHLVSFTHADVRDWAPGVARVTHVAVNPPWGGRLQGGPQGQLTPSSSEMVTGDGFNDEGAELLETWFQLGLFLKKHCAGSEVAVLSGNRDVIGKLFLSPRMKHPVTVGGIDCRVLQYTMLPPKKPVQ